MVRRLSAKLVQRIALVLLRPRNLLRNSALLGGRSLDQGLVTTPPLPLTSNERGTAAGTVINFASSSSAEPIDEEFEVPEQLEEIVGAWHRYRLIFLCST